MYAYGLVGTSGSDLCKIERGRFSRNRSLRYVCGGGAMLGLCVVLGGLSCVELNIFYDRLPALHALISGVSHVSRLP